MVSPDYLRVGFIRDVESNCLVMVLESALPGVGIEFQRALSFDEQDVAAGMDTYCICLPSGATHYGGVKQWSIRDGQLQIAFDPQAAEALGLPTSLRLAVRQHDHEMIRSRLPEILGIREGS